MAPYSTDFAFAFNGFPDAPAPDVPSSASLFSQAETNDLLGFLDNFNNFSWDNPPPSYPPYTNNHVDSAPLNRRSARPHPPSRAAIHAHPSPASDDSSSFASSDHQFPQPPHVPDNTPSTPASRASKPLLSTPQKRLNHIMSEQKRRNAIRDGYAQLIALLAPEGSGTTLGMPTRGRPKGSGSKGRGQTKGKSGVLFRAVEYCRWLEEGRDALHDEVLRLEKAADSSLPQTQ